MEALLTLLHADWLINLIYLVSVLFFVIGLKKLGSPKTARQGNALSMAGMFLAMKKVEAGQAIFELEFAQGHLKVNGTQIQ